MTTFEVIKKHAQGAVTTFEEAGTPDGYWGAVTLMFGLNVFYLLKGQKDDLTSEIVGHLNIKPSKTDAYVSNGLFGGTYLGEVKNYREAFAHMAL